MGEIQAGQGKVRAWSEQSSRQSLADGSDSADISLGPGGASGGPNDPAGRTLKKVDLESQAETFRPKGAKQRDNNPVECFQVGNNIVKFVSKTEQIDHLEVGGTDPEGTQSHFWDVGDVLYPGWWSHWFMYMCIQVCSSQSKRL